MSCTSSASCCSGSLCSVLRAASSAPELRSCLRSALQVDVSLQAHNAAWCAVINGAVTVAMLMQDSGMTGSGHSRVVLKHCKLASAPACIMHVASCI